MRGKQAKKRILTHDPIYRSIEVTKFINYVMKNGKKNIARTIVYKSLENAGKQLKLKPIDVFTQAINNIKPKMEVRSRRVGGANYQVPVPVAPDRQQALAFRWIVNAARENRKKTDFVKSLSNELVNAYKKEGLAFKKQEETHRMAEANKAFAHFQW